MSQTVEFKGAPHRIRGPLPKVGSQAPHFSLVREDLTEVTLESFGSQTKLLSIFPSLDTSVCAQAARTFYHKCLKISNLSLINISMDLPFAQKRFCDAEKLPGILTLSAFRGTFPKDYGLEIIDGPLKGLLARAVLILDPNNTIRYFELVKEITQEPDYQRALREIAP